MVTHKDSDKYRNLQTNDYVSLLIDTRSNQVEKSKKALTVNGRFSQINDEATLYRVKKELINRHPELKVFLDNESSCVFTVEIESFLLLDGFTDSYFVTV